MVLGGLTGLIKCKLLKGPQRREGKEMWTKTSFPSPQVTHPWLTGLLSQAETGLIVMLGTLIGELTNLQECVSAL